MSSGLWPFVAPTRQAESTRFQSSWKTVPHSKLAEPGEENSELDAKLTSCSRTESTHSKGLHRPELAPRSHHCSLNQDACLVWHFTLVSWDL